MLEELVRSSLTESRCIEASRFIGYAHEFLAAFHPEQTKHTVFELTPLMGVIIDYSDLQIVQNSPTDRGAYGTICRGTQKSWGLPIAVKKVVPSRTGEKIAPDTVETAQLYYVLRKIISGIFCEHPAVLKFIGWNDRVFKSLLSIPMPMKYEEV
jgi:hypothetical protein